MARKYNIGARSILSARRRSSIHFLDGRDRFSRRIDHYSFSNAAQLETDFILAKMRTMTPEEAAAAAAQAVAEAELAIAKAEEAMREVEAAEAAQAFAEAALKTLKKRNTHNLMPCFMESGVRVSKVHRRSD